MAEVLARGVAELEGKRTRYSKTFLLADGKLNTVVRRHPLHWDDAGTMRDIHATPTSPDGGRTWTTPSTPYAMIWDSAAVALTYRSREGGELRVRLVAVDGAPPQPLAPTPEVIGQVIRSTVAPDLVIDLRVRGYGVEIVKHLLGPLAPRRLTWEVVETGATGLRTDLMGTQGFDNVDFAGRGGRRAVVNTSRRIELLHTRSEDDLRVNPGARTYTVTEEVTGRTRFIDPDTRSRTWSDELVFPVMIDVTVSESVVADADDGYGTGGFWYSTAIKIHNSNVNAGVRFQTVDVPQGATIDSATLRFNVTSTSSPTGFTSPLILAGQATDDAPAWTNGSANDPDTMAATTATANVTVQAAGIRTITVTSIIQEIVNRAGWVALNDMRLGISDSSTTGSGYMFWEDYNAAGTAEPELDITYTAAAGGDAVPVAWQQYRARRV